MRGAWIEITSRTLTGRINQSLPVRGAWIEIREHSQALVPAKSLPVRGAWIEMAKIRLSGTSTHVAPRAGSVD